MWHAINLCTYPTRLVTASTLLKDKKMEEINKYFKETQENQEEKHRLRKQFKK